MLVKNQLLEEIVAQLATTKITDDILIKEFKKNGRAVTQVESFHGILGEMHMQLALQEICAPYEKRVQSNPIPSGASTDGYRFRRNTYGNLAVFRKKNGQQHGEFDELLQVDGLPVVFESKLHRTPDHPSVSLSSISAPYGKFYLGRYEAMFPQKINHLLDQIQQYFHQQACGYVLIVYPSQLPSPHPVQQEFLRNGGILVPFPKDWQEHRKETQELFKRMRTE